MRHYLYPVHLTGAFLSATTLASSLYLAVGSLLERHYVRAFKLAGPSTLLTSSDTFQFLSTCSSLLLVFGCSNVAC